MNKLEFVGIQKFSLYPTTNKVNRFQVWIDMREAVAFIRKCFGVQTSNKPIPALLQSYV